MKARGGKTGTHWLTVWSGALAQSFPHRLSLEALDLDATTDMVVVHSRG
ncbi:MAG: hypothetical protein JWQ90_2383 [Hydrocarboniphaga sp.]|nr:hypothetical protein [Hydrocarboniphaga sp.]